MSRQNQIFPVTDFLGVQIGQITDNNGIPIRKPVYYADVKKDSVVFVGHPVQLSRAGVDYITNNNSNSKVYVKAISDMSVEKVYGLMITSTGELDKADNATIKPFDVIKQARVIVECADKLSNLAGLPATWDTTDKVFRVWDKTTDKALNIDILGYFITDPDNKNNVQIEFFVP